MKNITHRTLRHFKRLRHSERSEESLERSFGSRLRMTGSLRMAIVGLILLGNQSFAEVAISGRAFSDLYFPTETHEPKTFQQLSASLWLDGAWSVSSEWTFKATYLGQLFEGPNSRLSGRKPETNLDSRLREAYANYSKQGIDLKVGKIVAPWGKADGFNPTDYLSGKDSSFFNPDEEVKRQGFVGLLGSLTPSEGESPWTYTLAAVAVPAQSRYILSPDLIAPPTSIDEDYEIPAKLENHELAGKVSYAGSGWDFSVSGFHGYAHLPYLYLHSFSIFPPRILLDQRFQKKDSVGLDASTSFSDWIWRIESSYNWLDSNSEPDGFNAPTHWDSVVGVERPWGSYLRFQMQLILRYIPKFVRADDVGAMSGLARTNALILGFQDPIQPSSTFRISYDDQNDKWLGDIFYLQNYIGHDFLIQPKISYKWFEGFKTTVGLLIYGGPGERQLGSLKSFNSVFLESMYVF